MPLKCLIIGKGESQGFERVPGPVAHQLDFKWLATETQADNSPIIDISGRYNYLFLHPALSGSPDSADAYGETVRAIKTFWDQGYKDRIVGISVGPIPESVRQLGIAEMTGVYNDATVRGWAWKQVPEDFNRTAADLVKLLEAREKTYLAALYILSQGYLATHAEFAEGSWWTAHKASILDDMGWNGDFVRSCSEQLKTNRSLVQSGAEWWRPVFAPLTEDTLLKEIAKELTTEDVEANESYKQIATLVKEIYGSNERMQLRTVAEAYLRLKDELE